MHALSLSQVVPPGLSSCKYGTALFASQCLTWSSSSCLASLGLPAIALPRVLSAQLPIYAPPTGLDECFFFNSLAVGLPYSSIFCQFWLFLFLNCCCPSFGCARRHSVSTYASILAGSLVKLHHSFLMHSFTDGHLGCLQHLHVINNTAMNIGLQRFS